MNGTERAASLVSRAWNDYTRLVRREEEAKRASAAAYHAYVEALMAAGNAVDRDDVIVDGEP